MRRIRPGAGATRDRETESKPPPSTAAVQAGTAADVGSPSKENTLTFLTSNSMFDRKSPYLEFLS